MARLRSVTPLSSQPLEELLAKAYRDGLLRISELFRYRDSLPEAARPSMREMRKQHPVILRTAELEGWLSPEIDEPDQRKLRADKLTGLLDEAGAPYEVTALMRKGILNRRKGRPIKPETRLLAKRALEAKWRDPKFNLMTFALSNCTCGKEKHDWYCKERIRQAMIKLEGLLRPSLTD